MRKLNFEQKTTNFVNADAFRLMTTKITTKSGINFETISCITDFRIMLNYEKTEILRFIHFLTFEKYSCSYNMVHIIWAISYDMI